MALLVSVACKKVINFKSAILLLYLFHFSIVALHNDVPPPNLLGEREVGVGECHYLSFEVAVIQ